MTRYLLDTNAISSLITDPLGQVGQRAELVGHDVVCTSVIAAAEIRYGVAKRGSADLAMRAELVLGSLRILPFEPPMDAVYGTVRAGLEKAGTPIGDHDILIAAHALALDYTVVTDNEREFRRIPSLRVENWLRPA
ncbi:PIN domain-containing protein [Brevundimonas sp.]